MNRALAAACALATALAAFAPAVSAAPEKKAPKVSGTYVGKTKQGKPITIKVSNNKMSFAKFGYTSTCEGPPLTNTGTARLNSVGDTVRNRAFSLGNGVPGGQGLAKGTFSKNLKKVSGTVSLTQIANQQSCRLENTSFTATKR